MCTYLIFCLHLFFGNIAWAEDQEWDDLGVTNGVQVSRMNVEGSSLFAFRGEAMVEVPLAVLSGLILSDPHGPEWVDLMFVSELVERKTPTVKIIYQGYDLPWPISDRDYVLHQAASYDPAGQSFTLNFHSLKHPTRPENSDLVRAQAHRTYWFLKVVSPTQTHVTVEVHTDPKGSLPAWLVNLIQQDWPHKTITALVVRAQKGDLSPDPMAVDWSN